MKKTGKFIGKKLLLLLIIIIGLMGIGLAQEAGRFIYAKLLGK